MALFRDWYTQNVEGIERDRYVLTKRTLDSRFQLAVEELHEDRPFSLEEATPELVSNYLIWPPIAILLFYVRLFCNSVDVFVHGFEKHREHLL